MENDQKMQDQAEKEVKETTDAQALSDEDLDQVAGGGLGNILKLNNISGDW